MSSTGDISLRLGPPGPVLQDFKYSLATNAIRGFDIHHQLWRLRNVKHMQDAEVELIMRTLVDAVQTYDQVVEVSWSPLLLRIRCSALANKHP